MLLFHFNLGYPLLDEDAVLIVPTAELIPRDAEASKGAASHATFQKPTKDYAEQVFYHRLKADEQGHTGVTLVNEKLGLGAVIRFSKKQLVNFTQWKQMGEGAYVLGIEPCNCKVGGRADERSRGTLEYLEPGETREFDLEIEILSSPEEIKSLRLEQANYK